MHYPYAGPYTEGTETKPAAARPHFIALCGRRNPGVYARASLQGKADRTMERLRYHCCL